MQRLGESWAHSKHHISNSYFVYIFKQLPIYNDHSTTALLLKLASSPSVMYHQHPRVSLRPLLPFTLDQSIVPGAGPWTNPWANLVIQRSDSWDCECERGSEKRGKRREGERSERQVDWLNHFLSGHAENLWNSHVSHLRSKERWFAEKEGIMNGTHRLKRRGETLTPGWPLVPHPS